MKNVKKRLKTVKILTILLSACASAGALPPGKNISPSEGLAAFKLGGKIADATLTLKDGVLFLETKSLQDNPWDVQAQARVAQPVKKGDRILASFKARVIRSRKESGEAESLFVYELAKDPWIKSVNYPFLAGREWKEQFVRFEAATDYAANEAQVIFRMGFNPQSFEVRDLKVENFGKSVELKDLPVTLFSYKGREAAAPWRAGAQKRIRENRMAPLKVTVLDASGKPVAGAKIEVIQKRNAFGFGSALAASYRAKAKPADLKRYDEEARRLFNAAVEENSFKWKPLAGDWGKEWTLERGLGMARWARENGMLFRGHVLVWPSWINLPSSLKALENDKPALRKAVLDHVTEIAGKTRGLTGHWDVVNEPFDNHDLQDILGFGILVDSFKAARAANPEAKLFINDYAILAGGGGDTGHRRHYEKTLKDLIAAGAPFDAFGMQGHFGASLTEPDDALKILDRFAKAAPGKEIWITEYDIDVEDLALAGDYLRDLLTLFYSHPAAGGFMMWGFTDAAHWHEKAPLYHKDWAPKPALKVWEDLVLKEWMTQAVGQSDAKGSYSARGHLGDYVVKAALNGKSAEGKVTLKKGGSSAELRLN